MRTINLKKLYMNHYCRQNCHIFQTFYCWDTLDDPVIPAFRANDQLVNGQLIANPIPCYINSPQLLNYNN